LAFGIKEWQKVQIEETKNCPELQKRFRDKILLCVLWGQVILLPCVELLVYCCLYKK
jgi:hypothetical protein